MRKFTASVVLVALLGGVVGFSTPSRAETGQVAVVFTKGGLIVGIGGGEGVLVLRGHRYPFTVSGMSVGFTIGASTTKLVGRALNLKWAGLDRRLLQRDWRRWRGRRRRRRRSIAERQWRDLAAQWAESRRRVVGCGGRSDDPSEIAATAARRSGRGITRPASLNIAPE